jgi:hypothetical protein
MNSSPKNTFSSTPTHKQNKKTHMKTRTHTTRRRDASFGLDHARRSASFDNEAGAREKINIPLRRHPMKTLIRIPRLASGRFRKGFEQMHIGLCRGAPCGASSAKNNARMSKDLRRASRMQSRFSGLIFTLAFLLAAVFRQDMRATETASRENAKPNTVVELKNSAGVRYVIKDNTTQILFHGKPVETANDCVFFLEKMQDRSRILLPVQKVEQPDERTAIITGSQVVGGVNFSYSYKVVLDAVSPMIQIAPAWETDKDLNGYEVVFQYHRNKFLHDWRMQHYPFAGNSESCYVTPVRYCGVPGMLLYKPDLSTVLLYTIDSRSDYCNPTTWTGTTRFGFVNQKTAPAFAVCKGQIKAKTKYEFPLQIYLDDSGKFATAVPNIVKAWMKTVDYKVEPLFVRTPQEAFDLTVDGRLNASFWMEGKGYEHLKGSPFIYIGNNPYIAYFEYLLYKKTGDKIWRDRAFQQIDFTLKGQLPGGAIHTCYNIKNRGRAGKKGEFVSWCHGHNGYKVDINAWAARYILETWKAVKEHENIDKKEWYDAAIRSLDWILRQQNKDGGFPQCVDMDAGGNETKKSQSVVCGRLMVALPKVAKITGKNIYFEKALEAEKFMREKIENRFWYTGAHPDLPPEDFEQDSIYSVVEYWLDKYDRTGEKDALDHAVANAYYCLLYWCPKQLSWVTKPTQCAHSEQQNYNQYSVYNYCNRKIQCLDRLRKATNDPLFGQLGNRVMQLSFATQITKGKYRGSVHEAIADPWLERGANYDFTIDGKRGRNSPYTSELVADMMIQLMELGLTK